LVVAPSAVKDGHEQPPGKVRKRVANFGASTFGDLEVGQQIVQLSADSPANEFSKYAW